ncbi:MAG: hypothetical protein NTW21_14380 [Verrucomicrobia bacterium]|nr:hypothetical protein [Verrucomicrobiota bacterium]
MKTNTNRRNPNAIQAAAQACLRTLSPPASPVPQRWRLAVQAVALLAVCGITVPRVLAQSVPFSGFDNSPLGAAHLAVTPAGLAVSNIGSSGQDGVSIALPASNSAEVVLGDLTGDGLPDLAVLGTLDVFGIGVNETIPDSTLVRGRMFRPSQQQVVCTANFSGAGSTALMAMIYRDGQLLAEVPASQFTIVSSGTGDTDPVPQRVKVSAGGSCDLNGHYHLWLTIGWSLRAITPVTVGGILYDADRVDIMSEDSPSLNGHLTRMELKGKNLPLGFVLASESNTAYSVPFRMHDHVPA